MGTTNRWQILWTRAELLSFRRRARESSTARSMTLQRWCERPRAAPSSSRALVSLPLLASPITVALPVYGRGRGREIIKIVPGSQAEKLGVQLGWKISHVGGKEMPPAGQPAADGITKALAAGKKGGRRYSIKFSAPAASAGKSKSPRGVAAAKSGAMAGGGAAAAAGSTKLPSAMGSLGKPVSSKKSSKLSTSTAFGAFGAFSSGLGAVGMSEEKLMQAHQSMAKLNEEMALVDMM